MYSLACIWTGISRIVYGATRDDVNAVYFETRHADTADFVNECFRDDIEIVSGILKEECTRFMRSLARRLPKSRQLSTNLRMITQTSIRSPGEKVYLIQNDAIQKLSLNRSSSIVARSIGPHHCQSILSPAQPSVKPDRQDDSK
jgi:hypothetical protein